MPREWWRDQSVMGQLAEVKPMSPNVPYNMKNAQGIAPAGTVEEGEYVMDKPVVDKLGPQVLDQLRQKVKTGLITKDQLQSNIAGGDSPSYKCGGMVKRYNKGGLVKSYQLGGMVTQKNYTDPLRQGPILGQVGSAPPERLGAAPIGETFGADYRSGDGAGPGGTSTFGADYQTTDAAGRLPSKTGDVVPFIGPPEEPPETAGVVDTIPPKIPKGIPSAEERYRGLGMAGIADIAAGEHPLFRTLANMAQQQVSAQGAMDTAALRQQMAQMGVTGGAANALMADIQRDIGSQMAGAAAQTAMESQRLSTDAIKTLASEGLLGMKEERIAKGEEYGVLMNQYEEALASGQFDQAEQIWNNIMGRFPEYSTGVKPDFEKLSKTYSREQIDDINSTLGKLIGTGSSFEEVRGYLTDKLETESGMSLEELAAQKGMSEDELLQDVYDRIKEFGADDMTRMLNIYKDAYKNIVDTPEEEEALENWVNNMYLDGNLEIDQQGNLTVRPESALLPWNAPSTSHLFDQAYSLSPDQVAEDMGVPVDDPAVQTEIDRRTGIRDMRTDYVDSLDSGQTPVPWDEWETGYNDALEALVGLPNYDSMSDEEKDTFVREQMDEITARPEVPGISDTAVFTAGEHDVHSTDQPGVYKYKAPDGKWEAYTFDMYRADAGTDMDNKVISDMLLAGDDDALAYAGGEVAKGNLGVLQSLSTSDSQYQSIAKGLTGFNGITNVDDLVVGNTYKMDDGQIVKIQNMAAVAGMGAVRQIVFEYPDGSTTIETWRVADEGMRLLPS
jgi:hypothetical protein